MLLNTASHAGILAASTRVIYPQEMREKSLILANTNDHPIVAQIWVDDGQGNPDQAKAPFVVLPSVFRMNSKGIQVLRIVHNGDVMPHDRESVYWLNLYEIPGKTPEQSKPLEENQARLDLAMNTQLKIFYRPKGFKALDVTQLAGQLRFSVEQDDGRWLLVCHNPTPYHASFTGLKLVNDLGTQAVQQDMDMMTMPFSQRRYGFDHAVTLTGHDKIQFYLIGDDGEQHEGEKQLETDRNAISPVLQN